ncbi:ribosome maturation factor RimM [Massilia sp. Leaf139]|uniref:ribosome maturation factor RimM n=1 Tax=Massilia sp. Leaf139 TaxID=1736272 RepID=UPI0006F7A0DD|nr:ribosome maturation factor RimM [Massilia sp. Leaf139]KQQ86909.1 ribosome maturation factor RimM [Massilia sp. Leaf139]
MDSAAAVANGAQAPDDLTQVGYVSGAYGVMGAIRVTPFSTDADALLNVKTWWLDKPSLHSVTVRTAKMHGGDVVATLVGMAGRDAAEALKGVAVHVSRAAFPALEEDEYYWSDLIGMDVVNLQGEALGKVIDMMSNGPQSILRIEPMSDPAATDKAPERLVPFVDQFVKSVDVKSKKITLDWGLDY